MARADEVRAERARKKAEWEARGPQTMRGNPEPELNPHFLADHTENESAQHSRQKKMRDVPGGKVECHTYDGPYGKGHVHIAHKVEGRKRYQATLHCGPEPRTDTGGKWVEVSEELI